MPFPASKLELAVVLNDSHARALAEPLVPAHVAPGELANWLYADADFALLAHDAADDPCFVYANLEAQRRFERSWEELIGMPSRLSAEAPNRAERADMLARVARDGFIRDYRGLRIAKSGQRFWIEGGVVWNVYGPDGERWGQAARFCDTTAEPPMRG